MPFPEYPTLHVQLKEPMLLEQEAFGSQLCAFQVHSSKSERKRNRIHNDVIDVPPAVLEKIFKFPT